MATTDLSRCPRWEWNQIAPFLTEERRVGDPSGFGVVYRMDRDMAVKVVKLAKLGAAQCSYEIQAWTALNHRGFVPLRAWAAEGDSVAFIMEQLKVTFASAKAMHHWTAPARLSAMRDIARALHYLELAGYAFCDVKTANMMLASDGRFLDRGEVPSGLLVDCGSLCRLSQVPFARTLCYMRPEWVALRDNGQDEAKTQHDVFAYGLSLKEVFTREGALEDKAWGWRHLLGCGFQGVLSGLDVLIQRCLEADENASVAPVATHLDNLLALLTVNQTGPADLGLVAQRCWSDANLYEVEQREAKALRAQMAMAIPARSQSAPPSPEKQDAPALISPTSRARVASPRATIAGLGSLTDSPPVKKLALDPMGPPPTTPVKSKEAAAYLTLRKDEAAPAGYIAVSNTKEAIKKQIQRGSPVVADPTGETVLYKLALNQSPAAASKRKTAARDSGASSTTAEATTFRGHK